MAATRSGKRADKVATKGGAPEKKMSQMPLNDYYWETTDEPHASRRKEILKKYPEIKELFGHDPNFKYQVVLVVAAQLVSAYALRHGPSSVPGGWWTFLAYAYVVGGTLQHNLMLAMHELSHNLGFKSPIQNRIFAMFANIPLNFPSAIKFKKFHSDHHKYQGDDDLDVDIPTHLEARIFSSTFGKFLFVCFQILFYALRPDFVNYKKADALEMWNALVVYGANAVMVYYWGPWSLCYLGISTVLGAGLHPVAGHFIAEHFVFTEGCETYSYYGPLNYVTYNVGYHNEHHDFPFVAGSRLPMVRSIASEYYDTLPSYDSWSKVIYDYLTRPDMTPYSRVKRHVATSGRVPSPPAGTANDEKAASTIADALPVVAPPLIVLIAVGFGLSKKYYDWV